jgi:ligand-binding SRPBCC domain-containing protein
MRTHTLEADVWLPHPEGEVFAFFANPSNLGLITPPWLSFRIVTPSPIEMKVGTRIEYRLKLRGIPIRWQSEITAWDPPRRFVDVQRRGPYRLWVHEHTFLARDNGTVVRDRVRYAVPGGSLVNRFLVRPDLDRIFSYRQRKLVEIFGPRP